MAKEEREQRYILAGEHAPVPGFRHMSKGASNHDGLNSNTEPFDYDPEIAGVLPHISLSLMHTHGATLIHRVRINSKKD